MVLLMLEGGINTLRTVVEGMERGTPVVVMGGSGRAADFLARARGFMRWEGGLCGGLFNRV